MRHICLIVGVLGLTSLSFAQQTKPFTSLPSNSLLIESHLGRAALANQGSRIIGGFGICSYWNLQNFQNTRESAIGISVPMRMDMTSPEEEVLIDYENSISVATLFRFTVQDKPDKGTLWFFMGAGPEFRMIWHDKTSSRALPLFQQEFGIKLLKPNSILLNNTEIGFAASWPLRRKEWDERLFFGSFFIRMDVF